MKLTVKAEKEAQDELLRMAFAAFCQLQALMTAMEESMTHLKDALSGLSPETEVTWGEEEEQ